MDSYKKMELVLADQFNEYINGFHREHEESWDIIMLNFLKNTADNQPDHTIQTVDERRKHVAWILVKENDRIVNTGTFFLLTESLGLTCFDVVKDARMSRHCTMKISFAYTEMGSEGQYYPAELVTCSESYNYAFLQLPGPFPDCPGGLLQHLALPPQDGAVAIIGHPQGQYKQTHFCSVINLNNHEDPGHPSFVHVFSLNSLQKLLPSKLVTDGACFFDKASGAPVFNGHGELVAMHSGNYTVNSSATTKPVIEYGRSIVEIITMGALEIKDLRCKFLELVQRNEALKSYMSSGSHAPHMKNVVTALMQLWQVERKQICPEDLYNVLNPNYISQRVSILSKHLLPSLHYETTQEPSPVNNHGCHKCNSVTCKVCEYMKEGTTFSSYQTGETRNIGQRIDCNSTHVIYLISCTECQLQYVGCTTGTLKERIRRHITDVKHRDPKSPSSVAIHFRDEHQGNLQSLQFHGIKMIENPSEHKSCETLLHNIETIWIDRLKSDNPYGLNKIRGSIRLHI